MNKTIFLLLFVLLISTCTAAQTPSPQEKKVLDLSVRKFNWLIGKQYDSLETLLDDHIMYVHSNGWVQNKREVIDDLKSGKLNYVKVNVKEATARIYDKAAIVNGTGTIDGMVEGKSFVLDLRYTEIYILKGKNWSFVSRHANKMP
ncbi:MAG TPA: nuclear transport factor 2 family protein [Cyclobacteriaceae bacterium]|nr:nuclear transport factor 2 family protein [Cyclobacteriaceae bacterium]